MNISIVIPNFNGEDILKQNLPKVLASVENYKKGKVEIIIPDDPSTDNSARVIDDFIQSIKNSNITGKTCSNKNSAEAGFSKNVNRGVKLATGEILILLNSDVTPHKDFLTPLLDHFNNKDVFAVACMDESMEDGKTVYRGRGVGKWQRGFLVHSAGHIDKTDTLWASGGSSAFNKSIWDKIGGLDNLFNPFYWEDIDLSYRALKDGYKILFEKKSVVKHEHDKGAIKTTFKSFGIQTTAYRNQFFFVWKNADTDMLIFHVLWLPYHFAKALLNWDRAFFLGFYKAFKSLPIVLSDRRKIQKQFVKTDMQVVSEIK